MAQKYEIKLVRSTLVAEGTMAFYFEKPAGFAFVGGQSVDITLMNPPETDAEGNKRAFSIASAPHEPELMITTRMRDTAFKRVLKTMVPGATVIMEGPFGSFTLMEDAVRPAVFLIGGIGITPVRSMIADATARELLHKLILFYSNRRPEDTAFFDDLKAMEKQNSHFTFIPSMTQIEKSNRPWDGESGYIDKAMILRHVSDPQLPVYYLAGPREMVSVMHRLLEDLNVPSLQIRTEEFTGY